VLTAFALLALASAGWAGYSWWSASRDTARTVAARDAALSAASKLAVTLQTVQADHPEDSMRAWQQASTGPLLRKLQTDNDRYLADLRKTPSNSEARVVDIALTELNAEVGTATAITALDVSQAAVVNGVAGPPTVRQLRVKLTLNLTDQGWKVSSSGFINA
jgi:Mce-associated membrane protein